MPDPITQDYNLLFNTNATDAEKATQKLQYAFQRLGATVKTVIPSISFKQVLDEITKFNQSLIRTHVSLHRFGATVEDIKSYVNDLRKNTAYSRDSILKLSQALRQAFYSPDIKEFPKIMLSLGEITAGNSELTQEIVQSMQKLVYIAPDLQDSLENVASADERIAQNARALLTNKMQMLQAQNLITEAEADLLDIYVSQGKEMTIAQKAALKQQQSINDLKATWQDIVISIGESVAPVVEELVPYIKKALEFFQFLVENTNMFAAGIALGVLKFAQLASQVINVISLLRQAQSVSAAISAILSASPLGLVAAVAGLAVGVGTALYMGSGGGEKTPEKPTTAKRKRQKPFNMYEYLDFKQAEKMRSNLEKQINQEQEKLKTLEKTTQVYRNTVAVIEGLEFRLGEVTNKAVELQEKWTKKAQVTRDVLLKGYSQLASATQKLLDAELSYQQTTGDIDLGRMNELREQAVTARLQEAKAAQKVVDSLRKAAEEGEKISKVELMEKWLSDATAENQDRILEMTKDKAEINVVELKHMASIFEQTANVRQAQSDIYEINQKYIQTLDVRREHMRVEVQQAQALVDLMDNYAIGVGASAEMRMRAFEAASKEIQVLDVQIQMQKQLIAKGQDVEKNIKRLKELELDRLNIQKEQASMVKALRDGWISAIQAANTGAGRFNKIVITQQKATAQALNLLKDPVISSFTGARRGGIAPSRFTAGGFQAGKNAQGGFTPYKITGVPQGVQNLLENFRSGLQQQAGLATKRGYGSFGTQATMGQRGAVGVRLEFGMSDAEVGRKTKAAAAAAVDQQMANAWSRR